MGEDDSSVFTADGLKKIQGHLEMLRRDLGASGAMLLDNYGHLIVECGKHGSYDVNTFLALLGNAMTASNAVNRMLHDKTAFDLHIHEGTNYEMYTSRITDQRFLSLTLEKHSGSSRVGMVWITLRRTVAELRELIEQAEVKPGTTEDREIQDAVSDSLTEALDRLDSGMLADKPAESPSPAPDPRDQDAPPEISPEDLTDPDRPLTYEQARRLGLINLDNIERDSER